MDNVTLLPGPNSDTLSGKHCSNKHHVRTCAIRLIIHQTLHQHTSIFPVALREEGPLETGLGHPRVGGGQRGHHLLHGEEGHGSRGAPVRARPLGKAVDQPEGQFNHGEISGA